MVDYIISIIHRLLFAIVHGLSFTFVVHRLPFTIYLFSSSAVRHNKPLN